MTQGIFRFKKLRISQYILEALRNVVDLGYFSYVASYTIAGND